MVKYKNIIITFIVILLLAGGFGAYMFYDGQSKAKASVAPQLASDLIAAAANLTIAPESLNFLSATFSDSKLISINYIAEKKDGKLLKFNFEIHGNDKPVLSEIYELTPYKMDQIVWQKDQTENKPTGQP
jgi:flagellar basal body-associated protein FliL